MAENSSEIVCVSPNALRMIVDGMYMCSAVLAQLANPPKRETKQHSGTPIEFTRSL